MACVRCNKRTEVLRLIFWWQRGEQLETVVQCQAYIRRRMQAPGRLVVETNDKHCDVIQEEEEYDDDCVHWLV